MPFVLEESVEQDQTPSFAQELGRHAGRSTARAAETLGGIPGDIQDLLFKALGYGAKKLGVPEEKVEQATEISKQISPGGKLPTSQSIRETIKETLGSDYLEPKNKGEAIADDIVSDAAALLIPVKGKVPFLRALGTAAGSNLAKEGVAAAGVGEKGQFATKLGSMMLLGSLGQNTPKKYIDGLYKEAEETLAGSPRVNVRGLDKKLDRFETKLSKGLEAPTEKAVLDKVRKLRGKIKDGTMEVEELWSSKRSLNEEVGKVIKEAASKGDRTRARKLFSGLSKDLNQELAKYGDINPLFGKAFKDAENAFSALQQSELVGNFIKNNLRYKPHSLLLYPLLHMNPKGAILPAAGGAALYKSGQIGYRVMKSPQLRKYYASVLKSAAEGNAAAMNSNIKKLDDALKKEGKIPEKGRFVFEEEG